MNSTEFPTRSRSPPSFLAALRGVLTVYFKEVLSSFEAPAFTPALHAALSGDSVLLPLAAVRGAAVYTSDASDDSDEEFENMLAGICSRVLSDLLAASERSAALAATRACSQA